jgi:hypothetical protein
MEDMLFIVTAISLITFYVLSKRKGFILSFIPFCVLHVAAFVYLSTGERGQAGGWYIMLVQIPAAIIGIIAICIGASLKPNKSESETNI